MDKEFIDSPKSALRIIKNHRITHETNEYLILNTEDNTLYKKELTPKRAKEFAEKLEAVPTPPIYLLHYKYREVTAKEFSFPLPF